jgi:hypothetical protein
MRAGSSSGAHYLWLKNEADTFGIQTAISDSPSNSGVDAGYDHAERRSSEHRSRAVFQPCSRRLDLSWSKSSLSSKNGHCVEMARLLADDVGVRDSKYTNNPRLLFAPDEGTVAGFKSSI